MSCNFNCKYYKGCCTRNGWGANVTCSLLIHGGSCEYISNLNKSNHLCSACGNIQCQSRAGIRIIPNKETEVCESSDACIEELPFPSNNEQSVPCTEEDELELASIPSHEDTYTKLDSDECSDINDAGIENTKKLSQGKTFSIETATAYVDGSFNSKTKTYGFGVVLMFKDQKYEYSGSGNNSETAKIKNVAGELLGAMTAIKKAKDLGATKLIICYDYLGIEYWARGKWKTNNTYTKSYKQFTDGCGIALDFKKIKAHSGHAYNEMADCLAKRASGVA